MIRRPLLEYLRILLANRIKGEGPGIENVAGDKIKYLRRASFYGLYNDIYLDETYYLPKSDKPAVIVDCGANIGMSVLYLKSRWPNAKVICFEPNPEVLECLKENIEMNGLTDVTVHPYALGPEDGKAEFYVDKNLPGSTGASLLPLLDTKHKQLTTITVPVRKLSAFIPEHVDLLKVDIEGTECEVLHELHTSGALTRVERLYLEYHYDGKHAKYSLGEALSMLDEAGFDYVVETPHHFPLYRTEPSMHAEIIFAWKK